MATNIKYWKYIKSKKKYNNSTQYYNGHRYDSKFEAKYAEELDWRLKAGKIKAWSRQCKISLDPYGHHWANYYVDFKVIHNDDSVEFVEVKGYATEVWRLKWKMFEIMIPEIEPGAQLTIIK